MTEGEVNVSKDDPIQSLADITQQEGLFIAPKDTFTMRRRQERDRGLLYVLKITNFITRMVFGEE
jgi:hypothetical protein